jgi:hypothetical protein
VPTPKFVAVAPTCPLLQRNVKGGRPPTAVAVAEPLLPPQLAEVTLVVKVTEGGLATVHVALLVQPFASVIVTLYVPDGIPTIAAVVAPVFQR